ncbi:MAG: hypothetical protein M1818_005863 [Claussenomyces sp. TS43310]|nr:MAG: hypothetical protein M1818_005863 [Claussenomyces sp. TS43310]
MPNGLTPSSGVNHQSSKPRLSAGVQVPIQRRKRSRRLYALERKKAKKAAEAAAEFDFLREDLSKEDPEEDRGSPLQIPIEAVGSETSAPKTSACPAPSRPAQDLSRKKPRLRKTVKGRDLPLRGFAKSRGPRAIEIPPLFPVSTYYERQQEIRRDRRQASRTRKHNTQEADPPEHPSNT